MSIVVDSIEDEYKALNKWADEESKQINDWICLETELI
jgi:hypothetical protein